MKRLMQWLDSSVRITVGTMILGLAVFAGFILYEGPADAIQNIDAIYRMGTIQFTNNGAITYSCSTNGSASITCVNNSVTTQPAIVIDGATGGVQLPKYAKTAIDTLSAGSVGVLVIDTNGTLANQVCISTGTGVSQFRALQGAAALGCGSGN